MQEARKRRESRVGVAGLWTSDGRLVSIRNTMISPPLPPLVLGAESHQAEMGTGEADR